MLKDNPTIGCTKANYEPLCDIHFASFLLYPSIYIIGTWNILSLHNNVHFFLFHRKEVCSNGLIVETKSHQCLNAY
jgi:hypothetical protein